MGGFLFYKKISFYGFPQFRRNLFVYISNQKNRDEKISERQIDYKKTKTI